MAMQYNEIKEGVIREKNTLHNLCYNDASFALLLQR